MQKSKTQLAFTLIELLVVVAIIGILSGVIMVTMSSATSSATIAKGQVFSNSLRNTLGVNMIAEYKLDGNASDTWGTHTAGTVSGAVTQSSCPQGTCYSFDNTDDYIELSDSSDLRMTTGGTIAAWIYPKTVGENNAKIIHKGTTVGGTNGYNFRLDDTCRIAFNVNNGNYVNTQNNSITYNQWNFVAVSFSGTGRKLYVNGVDKTYTGGSETALPPDTAGVVRIGNVAYNTTNTFDGYIDDVQLYNIVIPTSQIQQLYVAGLNKLLANNGITKQEYDQRIAKLSQSYAEK